MRVRAEMVFAALQELGPATELKISEHLDIPNADIKNRNKVSSRLRDLRDSGIVEECGEEGGLKLYRLSGGKRQRGSLQDRLWRAACLKARKGKSLTAGEAALLAGGSREYAARCYRFWEEQKFLVRKGTERSRKYGTVPLFRVSPGKEKEVPPRWQRRAEEAKRKGSGVRGQQAEREQVCEALACIGDFVRETREILGETNVRVNVILNGVGTDLSSLVRRFQGPQAGTPAPPAEVKDGPESED